MGLNIITGPGDSATAEQKFSVAADKVRKSAQFTSSWPTTTAINRASGSGLIATHAKPGLCRAD